MLEIHTCINGNRELLGFDRTVMQKNNHRHAKSHRLAIFGLLATLALPATSTAGTPEVFDPEMLPPAPVAAADDPDCNQSTVSLEIDVATGNVYLVNPTTGNLTLTDNDINVYFGSLGHVVIQLHYTSSNWAVSVAADNGIPTTYRTTNGWLRYSITDEVQLYRFRSTWLSSMSAMSSMTPVVPDILIRPKPTCPPST